MKTENVLKELENILENYNEIERIEIQLNNDDIEITVESNDIPTNEELNKMFRWEEKDDYKHAKIIALLLTSFKTSLQDVITTIDSLLESDEEWYELLNVLFEDIKNLHNKNYQLQVIKS